MGIEGEKKAAQTEYAVHRSSRRNRPHFPSGRCSRGFSKELWHLPAAIVGKSDLDCNKTPQESNEKSHKTAGLGETISIGVAIAPDKPE
jgi:hypothetical protein